MLTWLVSGVTVRADSGYDAPQAGKTRGYRCWEIPKAKYRRMSHPGSCRNRWISCQLGLKPSIIWLREAIRYLLSSLSSLCRSQHRRSATKGTPTFYWIWLRHAETCVRWSKSHLVIDWATEVGRVWLDVLYSEGVLGYACVTDTTWDTL